MIDRNGYFVLLSYPLSSKRRQGSERHPLALFEWRRAGLILCLLAAGVPVGVLRAQSGDPNAAPKPAAQTSPVSTFSEVQTSVQQQLEASLAELTALREEIAKEKIPLSQKLSDLENQHA
jgi:DNA-binding transcriptional MerR regulator